MNNYMLLSMIIIYVRYDLHFNRRRLQHDNSVVEFVLHIDSTTFVITKRQNDIYLLAYEDCPFPAPSPIPLLFV